MKSPARESCCGLVRYMLPGDPYSIYHCGLTTTCVLHIALQRAYYTYYLGVYMDVWYFLGIPNGIGAARVPQ